MASNEVYTRLKFVLSLAKAGMSSGDPTLVGAELTGVCLNDTDSDGDVSVDVGLSVYDLSVKGIDDDGNSAVAIGDAIYYVAADTPKLSKKKSGIFFGIALETVSSGATSTINVLHVPALAAVTTWLTSQLTGLHVENVAADNVIGGVPVLHIVSVAGGAAANEDVTLTHKTRVIDAWAVHTGGAGEASDTIQVKNGSDAITDAMSWAGADTAIVRAAQINDAYHEIAAGGTLRVTTTDNDAGDDVGAGIVYVLGIRVA